jgi:hypothetical protein
MSPTIFRYRGYRAFFFSREEARKHVHVSSVDGDAKFWLAPLVSLADYSPGLSVAQLREMQEIVEERRDDIVTAWDKHFAGS